MNKTIKVLVAVCVNHRTGFIIILQLLYCLLNNSYFKKPLTNVYHNGSKVLKRIVSAISVSFVG